MKSKISIAASLLPALSVFLLVTAMPTAASTGVKNGLDICCTVILPSLFPFFVLSQLIAQLGLPQILSKLFEPIAKKLFGISGKCLTPFILGLTGGYPIGASCVADLVRSGDISSDEGERLLPFCNNTGPAFIIGAAGSAVFGSAAYGLTLYISHIMAAVAVGMLFANRKADAFSSQESFQSKSFAVAFTSSVKNAVTSIINVCGFVIFFAVITNLLQSLGLLSVLAGKMSAELGLELHFTRSMLSGILELGGGISSLHGLSSAPQNLALAAFIIGFGSLSVHCQTLAVIDGTNMKCARHFIGRILHGIISALFAFVFAKLMQN